MSNTEYPRLQFPSIPQDELEETLAQIEMKEYCSVAVLEAAEGVAYPVSFITPRRAGQMLEHAFCYIEAGLIVVPETTLAAMQQAAKLAWEEGFFNNLRPVQIPGEKALP